MNYLFNQFNHYDEWAKCAWVTEILTKWLESGFGVEARLLRWFERNKL